MDTDSARSSTNSPPPPLLAEAHHHGPYAPYQNIDPSQSLPVTDVFTDASPSRQQWLLRSRNARLSANRLSVSGLSNRLTQLIGNSEQQVEACEPTRNPENKLHKSQSLSTIGKKTGLGILEEISNATKSRTTRQKAEISIYQDNRERPLLQSSPLIESDRSFTSPAGFDRIQDSVNSMRLRELSLNEIWSLPTKPPSSAKAKSRKRSMQTQFDGDEYIEHTGKELQQVRDEAYSPLTRRPMKEKLRAANRENERLQQELAALKEKFESEVKRTVEHKTATEVELRRKVRLLEDSLEEKEYFVRELQYQHEEKRLDSNIIETLKAAIERLEQEKLDMEEINLSMNKRNEVLTQLLAMSPTKATAGFQLGSPVREKRNARPLSLILPRHPSSPDSSQQGNVSSQFCSPLTLSSTDIGPLKLFASQGALERDQMDDKLQHSGEDEQGLRSPLVNDNVNRRWTMYSDVSTASTAFYEESKPMTRRKARKFVAGSTQLKPLLLPVLTNDSMSIPSTSTASSPRCWPVIPRSEPDPDDTILAPDQNLQDLQDLQKATVSDESDVLSAAPEPDAEGAPGPADSKSEVDFRESRAADHTSHWLTRDDDVDRGLTIPIEPQSPMIPAYEHRHIEQRNHKSNHVSHNSLQAMPVPSTPDSLMALPRPLFLPANEHGQDDLRLRLRPCSLSDSPPEPLNMRKRRKLPASLAEMSNPVSKIRRRQIGHYSVHHVSPSLTSEGSYSGRNMRIDPKPSHRQLRTIRSHDNFVEVLRQKNFGVKPLAALTIRTVYQILATCTTTLREFRRQPFALARRVLANAWLMHWKTLGNVSWWVLGLFIQPRPRPRARAPIDWDQYDGESIASRYCSSLADDDDYLVVSEVSSVYNGECPDLVQDQDPDLDETCEEQKQQSPGWGQSLFLWGKFSAALMLAIGGAMVKGPGEMLKDTEQSEPTRISSHRSCQSCGGSSGGPSDLSFSPLHRGGKIPMHGHSRSDMRYFRHPLRTELRQNFTSHFEFRSDTQLDSSSFLEHIKQANNESTLGAQQSSHRRINSLFAPTSEHRQSAEPVIHSSTLAKLAVYRDGIPDDRSGSKWA